MAYSTALEEEEEAGWQCCMPPGAVFGCCPHPRGLQKASAAGTTRPPSQGRSKPTCSVLLCPCMGSIRFRSVSSPAAVLRGRRPRARWARSAAFPPKARKHGFGGRSCFNFTGMAPAEGLHGADHAVRARYSDFAICSCGGILQICQWYRVCDAGALRAEPLGHPLYLARSKEFPTRRRLAPSEEKPT